MSAYGSLRTPEAQKESIMAGHNEKGKKALSSVAAFDEWLEKQRKLQKPVSVKPRRKPAVKRIKTNLSLELVHKQDTSAGTPWSLWKMTLPILHYTGRSQELSKRGYKSTARS